MLLWIVQGLWVLLFLGLGLCYTRALRPRRGTLEWIVGCDPVFPPIFSWTGSLRRRDVLCALAVTAGSMGVWTFVSFQYLGHDLVWDVAQTIWLVLTQLLLPGTVGCLVYFLFQGLYAHRPLALFAGLYVATCPTDTMGATLVLTLVLLLAFHFWDNRQPLWWQYTALALCGASLAVGIYYFPLLLLVLIFVVPVVMAKALSRWSLGDRFWATFLLSVACFLLPFLGVLWAVHLPMGMAMKLPIFSNAYLFLIQSNIIPVLDWSGVALRFFLLWPMHWSWLVPFGLGYLIVFFAMIRSCGPRTLFLHWYLLLLVALWIIGGISAMALATMLGLGYLLTTLSRRNHPVITYIALALLATVRIAIAWLWLI